MLLRRFSKLALPVLVLVLAGCASSGPTSTSAGSPAASGGADEGVPVAPAAALTMFEQASAVMAAGDYLDAELRFKEFLLRYPAYPGGERAHVFDPVAASFYYVPGGGAGWRRESYDIKSLPVDPAKVRKMTTTDELLKGH